MAMLLFIGLSTVHAQTPALPADPNQARPALPVVAPAVPVTNLPPTPPQTPPITNQVSSPQTALASQPDHLVVAADSSLKRVISELAQAWADGQDSAPQVALQLTNAATLRARATQGAAWDVVISSDINDVQELVQSGVLSGDGQKSLARNSLVVYGRHPLIKDDDLEWHDLIGKEWTRVVLGNPDLVGSGRKARLALQKHDLWGGDYKNLYTYTVAESLALQMVQGKGADAVILNKTDLEGQSFPGYEIFPVKTEDAPPIFYCAAVIKNSKNFAQAKAFIEFCASDSSLATWQKHGFESP